MRDIVVHNPSETDATLRVAAELGIGIVLHSPRGAARGMGAGYFLEMIAQARQRHPAARSLAVLDCGTARGLALAALRHGAEAVSLEADAEVLAKIARVAERLGAHLAEPAPETALDLSRHADPIAACRAFLAAPPVVTE